MIEDDLGKVILFLIDQTSKAAKRFSQREFDGKGLGITIDQWVLLKIIEQNNGLSQKELAVKSLRDTASITRTLDLLEKKNLIARMSIKGNRRQYQVQITSYGNEFVQKHMDMIKRHREQSLKGFSEDEILEFRSMLLRVKDNMT